MQEFYDGGAVAVGQHIDQRMPVDVCEYCPESSQLDFVNSQPRRCFSLELLFKPYHVFVKDIPDGFFIDIDLFGDLGISTFEGLPPDPAGQSPSRNCC